MLPDVRAGRDQDGGRRRQRVVGMGWPEFLEYFRVQWRPGQHMALIGPTGCGKSTFACGVLESRRYVLALDPKGGDSTLSSLAYERLLDWPPDQKVFDRIAEGAPARYIVGNRTRTAPDRATLRDVLKRTLDGVFEIGGFTVYVDEFQLLADRKMMGLGSEVETLLVAARDKGISVVTSYQAPAWVPTAASRQARWVALWPTEEENVIKILAASIGRSWRLLWEAMEALPDHHVLVVNRTPRSPMIVTSAPRRD